MNWKDTHPEIWGRVIVLIGLAAICMVAEQVFTWITSIVARIM